MQELKKRSRRDDVHVITLPEGTYGSNAARFLSTFHAECLPELADKQIEIIRVAQNWPWTQYRQTWNTYIRASTEHGLRLSPEILLTLDASLYIIKGISSSLLPNSSYLKTRFGSSSMPTQSVFWKQDVGTGVYHTQTKEAHRTIQIYSSKADWCLSKVRVRVKFVLCYRWHFLSS